MSPRKGFVGIGTIEIEDKFRRMGYGTLLINYIARKFGKPIKLWTSVGEKSIYFYESLGFRIDWQDSSGAIGYILR